MVKPGVILSLHLQDSSSIIEFAIDINLGNSHYPDIHARFHHSPDEKARHPYTKLQWIMSEKRLHVPPLSFLWVFYL
jgi:hypothetical protein